MPARSRPRARWEADTGTGFARGFAGKDRFFMLRKTLRGALAVAALGLAVVGCNGDDSTVVGLFFVQSSFPGSALGSLVAADGRAMSSASGDAINIDVRCFRSTAENVALLAYRELGVGTFVTHRDASGRWSPPVQLQVERGSGGITVREAVYLNPGTLSTSARTSVNAGRRGDWVLLFTQQQLGDPSNSSDETTFGLFSVYVKRSLLSSPSASVTNGTVTTNFKFGVQVPAARVDSDPDSGAGGPFHVDRAFLVSDSIHGTHGFVNGAETPAKRSGDATTFLAAVYVQEDNSLAPGTLRYRTAAFDLGAAGFVFGAPVDLSTNGATALGTGDSAGDITLHNGTYVYQLLGQGANGLDTKLLAGQMSETSTNPQTSLVYTPTAGLNNDNDNLVETAVTLLGADDTGAARLFLVFTVLGDRGGLGAPTPGSHSPALSLFVASIGGPSETSPAPGSVNGQAELDPFVNVPASNYVASAVDQIKIAVARDGSFVWVGFVQNSTNSSGATPNKILKAAGFETARHVNDTTASPVASAVDLGVGAPDILVTGTDRLQAWKFQDDAEGYLCGFTSNVRRMNFLYTNTNQGGTPSLIDLQVAGATVAIASGAVPTLTAVASVIARSQDALWNGAPWNSGLALTNAVAYDNGTNTGGASDGAVNVDFVAQDNNNLDMGASGAYRENRLFHFDGTATALISTDGTLDAQQAKSLVGVQGAPYATAATANNSGDFVAQVYTLFWLQERNDSTRASMLYAHQWVNGTNGSTGAFAATGPQMLAADLPYDCSGVAWGVSGSRVDVYWFQNAHIWYQSSSAPGRWIQSGTMNMPGLVDTLYDDMATAFSVCWSAHRGCDGADGASIHYTKTIDAKQSSSTNKRLLVATHP
ncbi:MAG: hypothetical protein D6731_19495 [Planctomycetota bacterium]|nr:MAG: hypothetical protein D6731_19495 [Planctomycetota bacterium]